MRKLDSYVLREMLGPFIFGVAAFVIMLVSIELLYDALKLVVREGYPAGAVAKAFLYRMPQTVALTLPMATMFSTLMAVGRLSGDGEVVARRAGGINYLRVATPILLLGLLITGVAFAFNEAIVPHANAASSRLLAEMSTEVAANQDNVIFQMPPKGRPDRIVYAEHFDPTSNILKDVLVIELHGDTKEFYEADQAVWQGETILLETVVHSTQTPQGTRQEELLSAQFNVEMAPWEVKQSRKDPEDMTLAELRGKIGRYQQIPANARPGRELIVLREHYHIRLAVPWCALGFALIGVSLGQRPQRTSTGVGLGLSLAIILAYYIVFNILRVIGEQGTLPPVAAAWLPNFILFTIGVGLLIDAAR